MLFSRLSVCRPTDSQLIYVVPKPSGNLVELTSAVVRPILEFPRRHGMNGSCSRKSEVSWFRDYLRIRGGAGYIVRSVTIFVTSFTSSIIS